MGDHRLGDTPHVHVEVSFGTLEEVNFRQDSFMKSASDRTGRGLLTVSFMMEAGAGLVSFVLARPPGDQDSKRLGLLAALIRYFGLSSQGRSSFRQVPNAIGRALKEIRHSLRLPVTQVAAQIEVAEGIIQGWEAGIRADIALDKLYLWCKALGVFCPPTTALVRTVDVSPELLAALKENPEELRKLSPDQFEAFIANRLDRMGFNVIRTGPTNVKDGGIDIIAVSKVMNLGSFVLAAQVKHHRGEQKTGRDAVDRLAAWKGTPFGMGLLVTNTGFTKDAVWTAMQEQNRHFLRLRDFNDLKRWLEGQFGDPADWREIPDRIELAPGVVVEIPKPRLLSATGDPLEQEE